MQIESRPAHIRPVGDILNAHCVITLLKDQIEQGLAQ
jgi:hypothetical protein